VKQFTIAPNDAAQRLDKFLRKAAPALPQALLYKALRQKRIKLNGRRAEGAARLEAGDIVTCFLPDELFAPPAYAWDFLRAGTALEVLYEDERLLLLNKPAGLLSHPDEGEYVDTLLGRVQRYLYEKGEYRPERENAFAPSLCNRIDRNTQGIVIAAKTADALREINERIKLRQTRKFYLAAVHGEPAAGRRLPGADGQEWKELRNWLRKDAAKSQVQVYDNPRADAKESLTRYRVLARRGGLSLLEIELLTGRTHQIRAQLAHIGHALVGDGKYAPRAQYQADAALGRKRQCLCSWRLTLGELDVRVPDVEFVHILFPDFDLSQKK
jgi:23S rRNA pseudouridine955/2504/2580 synthase